MKRVMLFVSVLLSAAMPAQATEILRKVDMVYVSSVPKFVAGAFFIVNHHLLGVPGIVKIGRLSNQGMPTDNFERHLLGKTEVDVPATALSVYLVQEMAADATIRATIDDWQPIQLWDVYWMLAAQPQGEPGLLLTNGGLNYFHVRGTDGKVWIVLATWPDASGWWVRAVATGNYVILRGARVISF